MQPWCKEKVKNDVNCSHLNVKCFQIRFHCIYHLLYRSVYLWLLIAKYQFFSINPETEVDLNMMIENYFLACKRKKKKMFDLLFIHQTL